MKIIKTFFEDAYLIKSEVYKDSRGSFYVQYEEEQFSDLIGEKIYFSQDNVSVSNKFTLRGMHYQCNPYAQDKLLTVLKGKIQDVCIDLRNNSPYFGEYFSVFMEEGDGLKLWIPKGFAHGFLSLEDTTIVHYKVNNKYDKDSERCITWDDKNLNIKWLHKDNIVLSKKDSDGNSFSIENEYF